MKDDSVSAKKILVGVTGASGSLYALRLLEALQAYNLEVHLVISESGKLVVNHEIPDGITKLTKLAHHVYQIDDIAAAVASGSYGIDSMVILPCSMGTLGAIANGLSHNLLTRAADVILKEQRKLVLVPRETPFSTIHLENLLTLSRMGAVILPAAPGFYHHPQTITDLLNFIVGRILDHLKIPQGLVKQWTKTELTKPP